MPKPAPSGYTLNTVPLPASPPQEKTLYNCRRRRETSRRAENVQSEKDLHRSKVALVSKKISHENYFSYLARGARSFIPKSTRYVKKTRADRKQEPIESKSRETRAPNPVVDSDLQ